MTMYVAGKLRQVTNNGLSTLAISKARYTGSGQQRFATGELLMYSGHEKEMALHTQGVALLLSRSAQAH